MSLELPATEALLQYLAPTSAKPRTFTFIPPEGAPPRNRTEPHRVAIRDARKRIDAAQLDVEGFALVPHASAVRDFFDDAEVRRVYYPEVEALLCAATGAAKVVIFDHTLRSGSAERRAQGGVREPVRYVHNDYTALSGPQRVRDLLPADEARERLARRHAIVNVWRPLREPVRATPLALCDARSIRPGDLIATDLVYPDRVGEVYSVGYNPAHRWFFYPGVGPDEAILIKTYDSLEDGTARYSAHSAFEHPDTPADAPPRESIEVRALVFF